MKRFGYAIITTLALTCFSGVLFIFPLGLRIEENLGLKLLFKLRGFREPPGKAVVVNIDDRNSWKLGLSERYDDWPRTVHARLIDKLVLHGARLIVFDIHFIEKKNSAGDRALAEAIDRAGNVILVERLHHASIGIGDSAESSAEIEVETIISPMQPLVDGALAIAPFPLPKLPVRVNETWLFKESVGHTPTLPVVAFLALNWEQHDGFRDFLELNNIEGISLPKLRLQALTSQALVENIRQTRESLVESEGVKKKLYAAINKTLNEKVEVLHPQLLSLMSLYSGKSLMPIDFYGPPATITTLSYYDILSKGSDDKNITDAVAGKVIFVGAASRTWSNQKDGFYTVFSEQNGLDLSGVEMAATLFSNLHEGRRIQKVSGWKFIIILSLAAAFICFISFYSRPFVAIILLFAGMGISVFGALKLFAEHAIWVPVIVPFFVVPLAGFLTVTVVNFLHEKKQKKQIRKALGFYLPENVIEEVARDLSFIQEGDKMVYGVCLMTDAENYTRLSECNDPQVVSVLMKEYFKCLFCEVKREEGVVANVIGDAMLAIWAAAQPQVALREHGCKAALEILKAVELFNHEHPKRELPTRIGVHSGELLVGNIGAEDHFEYAPVGDIVNTASRIEGLNKKLSTKVLASSEALQGVPGILKRDLGPFLFSGKKQPVKVYELLPKNDHVASLEKMYFQVFPEAMALFQAGEWLIAKEGFEQCLHLCHTDGPSKFFMKKCEVYKEIPPQGWCGEVTVGK